MIAAGKLDRLATLQTVTQGTSPSGAPTEVVANYATIWVGKEDVTARERFRANQELGEETTVFRARWRSDVTSEMRLVVDGKTYDLAPPIEVGRREEMQLIGTVVRV